MHKLFLTLILLLVFSQASEYFHTTPEEIDQEIDKKTIYYGTTARIENFQSQYLQQIKQIVFFFSLHSHQVSYGTGSQQQSVTAMQNDNDYNSLWMFKECQGTPMKLYTDDIKCGDCVRLEHMLTGKNLHSHNHQSPVSGNQEVSAYGNKGEGDELDNWIVLCQNQDNTGTVSFKGSMWFQLQHQGTKKFLRANKNETFNRRNCGHNCPIEGQQEVCTVIREGDDTKWKIYGGLFYLPNDTLDEDNRHCNQYGSCDDVLDDEDDYDIVDYRKKKVDL